MISVAENIHRGARATQIHRKKTRLNQNVAAAMVGDLVNKIGTWGTAFAGICGLCGTVGGAVTYGLTFKQDFDSAKAHVAELTAKVSALQSDLASRAGTVKAGDAVRGERGPTGPQGPRGEQGPQGETGVAGQSVSLEDIRRLIDERLKKAAPSTTSHASMAPQGVTIDTSKCVDVASLKQAKSIVVQVNMEFCGKDEELLTKVTEIVDRNFQHYVGFFNPSGGSWSCNPGNTCVFGWLKNRTFTVERIFDKDDKIFSLLRFKDNG